MRISAWSSDLWSSDLGISYWADVQSPTRAVLSSHYTPRLAQRCRISPPSVRQNSGLEQGARSIGHSRGAIKPHVFQIRAAMVRSAWSATSLQGRSEEHTSELQSLMRISYAVFCLKKKIKKTIAYTIYT